MADLTVQKVNGLSGVDPLNMSAAAAGGDKWLNDDDTFLLVAIDTGAVGTRTVTIVPQKAKVTPPGFPAQTIGNIEVTLNADEKTILHALRIPFNDSVGKVTVTYDDNSDVKVAAVRLQRAS